MDFVRAVLARDWATIREGFKRTGVSTLERRGVGGPAMRVRVDETHDHERRETPNQQQVCIYDGAMASPILLEIFITSEYEFLVLTAP